MSAGERRTAVVVRRTVCGLAETVNTAAPAFREEIFGPVAPVIVVKDADEAVRVANDTEYGLVAAIQTGSVERGLEIADQLSTGIVHVNDQTLNNDAFAPFGGMGASGNGGRFGSQSSWDEFTQWQWVTSWPHAHGFPF
jgi:benzaldehyde dehydrogenase (NAD)